MIMKCEAYRNDRCEDMAAMNELNEPNVLNNLKRRFFSNLCQVILMQFHAVTSLKDVFWSVSCHDKSLSQLSHLHSIRRRMV